MTTETVSAPTVGRGRKSASVGGQVVGIVGFAVCVILAVLVLFGRGWAVGKVNEVGSSIDDSLAKGVPLLDAADARVSQVTTAVQELNTVAGEVVASGTPATDAGQRLSARLASVSEQYLPLRASYADARSGLVSALDRLDTVARFVPGVSVPQGPIDALRRLDEGVRAVDERVMALVGGNSDTTPATVVAQKVSTASAGVLESLDGVATRLDDAETRLTDARAQVSSMVSTATTAITIAALVVILALIYVAALHVVLMRSARGMGRQPGA